jgi:hypothetical protein
MKKIILSHFLRNLTTVSQLHDYFSVHSMYIQYCAHSSFIILEVYIYSSSIIITHMG